MTRHAVEGAVVPAAIPTHDERMHSTIHHSAPAVVHVATLFVDAVDVLYRRLHRADPLRRHGQVQRRRGQQMKKLGVPQRAGAPVTRCALHRLLDVQAEAAVHHGVVPALLVEESTGGAAALQVEAGGVVGGQWCWGDGSPVLGPLVRDRNAVHGLQDGLHRLGRVRHLALAEELLGPLQSRRRFSQPGEGQVEGRGGCVVVIGRG
mmetsp:Transcript_14183/g.34380  ORF Transcript_14183/g.34380 Transcript_14183/m.34380 type:complete len:206 (-) Transcript_14183:1789-2406(-)